MSDRHHTAKQHVQILVLSIEDILFFNRLQNYYKNCTYANIYPIFLRAQGSYELLGYYEGWREGFGNGTEVGIVLEGECILGLEEVLVVRRVIL